MKKQPDNYLYLLKKVHGWCKRQGMTDPEITEVSSLSAATTQSSNSKIAGYENT